MTLDLPSGERWNRGNVRQSPPKGEIGLTARRATSRGEQQVEALGYQEPVLATGDGLMPKEVIKPKNKITAPNAYNISSQYDLSAHELRAQAVN